jgi:hypothetical protein
MEAANCFLIAVKPFVAFIIQRLLSFSLAKGEVNMSG